MARQREPQQLRAARTRERLLAAARRVVAERGYDGATIDAIAEAARCSKGAYYFHFRTKEEILLALVDDWASTRTAELRDAPEEKFFETLLVSETGGGWGPRLIIELWEQGGRNSRVRQRLASMERSWRLLVEDRIQRRKGRGTVDALTGAQLALALRHGLLVQGLLGQVSRARAKACAATLEGVLSAGRDALRRAG